MGARPAPFVPGLRPGRRGRIMDILRDSPRRPAGAARDRPSAAGRPATRADRLVCGGLVRESDPVSPGRPRGGLAARAVGQAIGTCRVEDLIVGVLGALIGGLVFGLLGTNLGGLVGDLITATVGAVILWFLLRHIRRV